MCGAVCPVLRARVFPRGLRVLLRPSAVCPGPSAATLRGCSVFTQPRAAVCSDPGSALGAAEATGTRHPLDTPAAVSGVLGCTTTHTPWMRRPSRWQHCLQRVSPLAADCPPWTTPVVDEKIDRSVLPSSQRRLAATLDAPRGMAAVPPGQVHLGSVRGAVMSVPAASLLGSLSGRAQATSTCPWTVGWSFPCAPPSPDVPWEPLRVGGR